MVPSISENAAIFYVVNDILKPSTSLFLLISILLLAGSSVDAELKALLSNTHSGVAIRYFNVVGPMFLVVVSLILSVHNLLPISKQQWEWLIRALNHFVGLWAFSMSIIFCQIVFTFLEIGLSSIAQLTLGIAVSILFVFTLFLPAPLALTSSAASAIRDGHDQWGLLGTKSISWTLFWLSFASVVTLAIILD